jgi:hypothetical protein
MALQSEKTRPFCQNHKPNSRGQPKRQSTARGGDRMPDAWNSLLSETFPLSPPPRTKSLLLCHGIPLMP